MRNPFVNSKHLEGSTVMRNIKSTAWLVAIVVAFLAMNALDASAQNAANVHPLQVPQGAKQKIQGVVSIRSGDSFKVRDPSGGETNVLLTSSTDVTSHARGLRGKKDYPVTYIMRGLRLQAQGTGCLLYTSPSPRDS